MVEVLMRDGTRLTWKDAAGYRSDGNADAGYVAVLGHPPVTGKAVDLAATTELAIVPAALVACVSSVPVAVKPAG